MNRTKRVVFVGKRVLFFVWVFFAVNEVRLNFHVGGI
jgi:hypothetical protein